MKVKISKFLGAFSLVACVLNGAMGAILFAAALDTNKAHFLLASIGFIANAIIIVKLLKNTEPE